MQAYAGNGGPEPPHRKPGCQRRPALGGSGARSTAKRLCTRKIHTAETVLTA